MKTILLKNASVVGLQVEPVTMQSGEQRSKQTVFFTENTSRGVEMHGCTVWDDNIGRLNLQQGRVYDLSCRLIGRQWNGRFYYELIAFEANEVTTKREGALQDALCV